MVKKTYSPEQFSKQFKIAGKQVTERTVRRRCENQQLPDKYQAVKCGKNWIILVGWD